MAYRVIHYINQFFGGIGGEEKADIAPEVRDGIVGPGIALNKALEGKAEIVATIICGDNYAAEHLEELEATVLEWIRSENPDLFIAGPAFAAGRYGTACGHLCNAVATKLKIPVITAMHPVSPGVDIARRNVYIVETKDSARDIGAAAAAMVRIADKLLRGEPVRRAARGRLAGDDSDAAFGADASAAAGRVERKAGLCGGL